MSEHALQCMEVWGGNRAVNNGVVMLGVDAWVYCRPYGQDEAGGDVHYVSSCASGRIVRFMIADVSGHGAHVADLASRLRLVMGSYVNDTSQSRLVGGINREFAGLADLGKFATAVAATYWTPTDDLVVTLAGHPSPLRYQAAQRSWAPMIGTGSLPLGVEHETAYHEVRLRLRSGDLVLFYTDGVVERRNAQGQQLGEAGLIEVLSTLDNSEPQDLIRQLLERIDAFGAEDQADDDVTIVLIRRNDNKPRISLGRGIVASLRVIGALPRLLLDRSKRVPWPQMTWRNVAGAFFDRFNHTD